MAKEVVTQYKSQLYNVTDQNKFDEIVGENDKIISYVDSFKDYLTENGLERFGANRVWAIPLQACNKGNFSLKMKNIEFNRITEESQKVILEYTLVLEAQDAETGISDSTTETGEIVLIRVDNTWKIDHDRFEVADLIEQELGMRKGAVIRF